MNIFFTTNDDHTHMTGKGSVTEPDLEAKALGVYVEAIRELEPRPHWLVTGTFCGNMVFSFRTSTEQSVRERAQAAVDAERELCRPDVGSDEWPHAMPARVSEATELRARLAASESEAHALRAALLASKHEPEPVLALTGGDHAAHDDAPSHGEHDRDLVSDQAPSRRATDDHSVDIHDAHFDEGT